MSVALASIPVHAQVQIRPATEEDLPSIWQIHQEIIQTGGTYTLPTDYPKENAKEYWMGPDIQEKNKYYLTCVAVIANRVVGAYAVRPCYAPRGASSHVANGSYIVDKDSRGQRIAHKMGIDSLEQAQKLGYTKMQFNQVVSTNTAAIKVWTGLGLKEVGRSPGAFLHADGREADLLIMNRDLRDLSDLYEARSSRPKIEDSAAIQSSPNLNSQDKIIPFPNPLFK